MYVVNSGLRCDLELVIRMGNIVNGNLYECKVIVSKFNGLIYSESLGDEK